MHMKRDKIVNDLLIRAMLNYLTHFWGIVARK